MTHYYTLLQSRSHVLALNSRLKAEGIPCEITNIPREITTDMCNMGIRFVERDFARAMKVIKNPSFSGCRVFKEIASANGSRYVEIPV